MITLTIITGVFGLIAVVAAMFATSADNRAQIAWKRCAASLDIIREHTKKETVTSDAMVDGASPYRSLGMGPAVDVDRAQPAPPPMSTTVMYVSSVHSTSTPGNMSVFLSKYPPESKESARIREDKVVVDCDRSAAALPGEQVEVVIRRKTT